MQWRKANVIMDVQCTVAVKMIKFHKITPFPACIITPGGTGGKKNNQHNKEEVTMREAATYRDNLQCVRERAEELFPGKMIFNATQTAKILGLSRWTVRRRWGAIGNLTAAQIARLIS